jgi:hypothetical protein
MTNPHQPWQFPEHAPESQFSSYHDVSAAQYFSLGSQYDSNELQAGSLASGAFYDTTRMVYSAPSGASAPESPGLFTPAGASVMQLIG